MHQNHPRHVVVIGASLAGLFAAAGASAAGCQVTLLERDHLPSSPVARRGVPQGEQGHILLEQGMRAAEQLLPGLRQDFIDHGAPEVSTGRLPWLTEEGWLTAGEYGFDMVCITRTLLEHLVRERVLALPRIELRSGMRVNGLARAGKSWHVKVESASGAEDPDSTADTESVTADVVIDASGRSSRLPHWLSDLGVSPATVTTVDAKVGYARRLYSSPNPPKPGVVIMTTPRQRQGCVILPVENGRWLASAIGVGEHRPGRDVEAFEEHMRQLPGPLPTKLLSEITPVSDVAIYRQTSNVRHAYERIRDWPDGLLVLGDSLCAVNPTFGSGISVAANQGVTLRSALNVHRPLKTKMTMRRLARATLMPWTMASGQDRQLLPNPTPPKWYEALFGLWIVEVGRLATTGDVRSASALQQVGHLVVSPARLLHPALLATSARSRLNARFRTSPQRQSLRTETHH